MTYPLLPLSSVFIPELINVAYKINRECKNAYPFFFVLDDCPLDKNSKELLKTFTIYRNQGISACVCVQSPTLINPTNRSNSTFTLLFKCNASEQIESICKFFLRSYFPSKWTMTERITWYKKNTEDHFFIFIDNYAGTIQRCKLDLS